MTEIFLLVLVFVSVTLILIDLTVNLLNEINLQMQSNAGLIVLPISTQVFNLVEDQLVSFVFPLDESGS